MTDQQRSHDHRGQACGEDGEEDEDSAGRLSVEGDGSAQTAQWTLGPGGTGPHGAPHLPGAEETGRLRHSTQTGGKPL